MKTTWAPYLLHSYYLIFLLPLPAKLLNGSCPLSSSSLPILSWNYIHPLITLSYLIHFLHMQWNDPPSFSSTSVAVLCCVGSSLPTWPLKQWRAPRPSSIYLTPPFQRICHYEIKDGKLDVCRSLGNWQHKDTKPNSYSASKPGSHIKEVTMSFPPKGNVFAKLTRGS